MLQRKRRRRDDEDERILPLINIVFLLLIFFMVVGQLSASDPFEIEPLRSDTADDIPSEPLMVQVSADGRVALNGDILEEEALLAAIRQTVAQGETPDIRIKADGAADAQAMVLLLRKLRGVGVESIRLMTVAPPPSGDGS